MTHSLKRRIFKIMIITFKFPINKQCTFTTFQTFNCGAHDFKKASGQGIGHALSLMSQLDTTNEKFIALLTKSISEQFLNA